MHFRSNFAVSLGVFLMKKPQ